MGSLEPQFWAAMVSLMGLTDLPDRGDREQWPALKRAAGREFKTRTRAEWEAVFEGSDACVSPVLSMAEAAGAPAQRRPGRLRRGRRRQSQPAPAPRLLGTPPQDLSPATRLDDLSSWGIGAERADKLRSQGVLA